MLSDKVQHGYYREFKGRKALPRFGAERIIFKEEAEL